ncbi:alpha-1,2-fucosyltransferase [Runella aurantiaca]|uniref:Alpha-1,2-fucosyltransferase n=1 Tax=Runella aurantiaca TaxID=2282308 RepID=A0A369IJZ0_9BACT|nr:alpha-1,2-fucosyltransferase [Runella aurantiaca]RDB07693.1 alpha-1,2-fucosyltransferase [Runella aurantiaca]
MIIVKLSGGLGNQLFQYALGRQLSIVNHTDLKMDTTNFSQPSGGTTRTFALGSFNIHAAQANKDEIKLLAGEPNRIFQRVRRKIGLMPIHYFKEPHFHFYQPVLSLQDGVYLDGYWQSEKYFAEIADRIREDLKPVGSFSNQYETFKQSIKQSVSVSVHIRRGDYTTTSKANRYLKPCEALYYQTAVEYLTKRISNLVFFVFSDDIEWAKAHIHFGFPMQYVEGNSAQEDLLLIASCQHHIIANSTFSWWGAWLNPHPDKIVIAPQKWFSTERFDTKDLLPESWILL